MAAEPPSGRDTPLRVIHTPLNVAGIPWTNVQALRRRGVDARLVVVERQAMHPEADVDLARRPGRDRPLVVHAPSNRARKGTEQLVAACEGLEVDLEIVEGLHHDEAFARYAAADIVVDQLNAGWYGVFALEAMALGKPVLTFL